MDRWIMLGADLFYENLAVNKIMASTFNTTAKFCCLLNVKFSFISHTSAPQLSSYYNSRDVNQMLLEKRHEGYVKYSSSVCECKHRQRRRIMRQKHSGRITWQLQTEEWRDCFVTVANCKDATSMLTKLSGKIYKTVSQFFHFSLCVWFFFFTVFIFHIIYIHVRVTSMFVNVQQLLAFVLTLKLCNLACANHPYVSDWESFLYVR